LNLNKIEHFSKVSILYLFSAAHTKFCSYGILCITLAELFLTQQQYNKNIMFYILKEPL